MTAKKPLDPLTLANELRPALLRVARELRRESHALGVTAGQVALLRAIQKNPGVGVGQLADMEGVSAPNISIIIRRLERAELVMRLGVTDRRRVGLHITPKAARVLQSVKSRRTAWLAARLRQLEPRQLEAIATAVEPLRSLLQEDR